MGVQGKATAAGSSANGLLVYDCRTYGSTQQMLARELVMGSGEVAKVEPLYMC